MTPKQANIFNVRIAFAYSILYYGQIDEECVLLWL